MPQHSTRRGTASSAALPPPYTEQLQSRLALLATHLKPQPVGEPSALHARVQVRIPCAAGLVGVQRLFHQDDALADLHCWAEHEWLARKLGAGAGAPSAAGAGGCAGAEGGDVVVLSAPPPPPLPFTLVHGPGRAAVANDQALTLLAANFVPSASFTLVPQ